MILFILLISSSFCLKKRVWGPDHTIEYLSCPENTTFIDVDLPSSCTKSTVEEFQLHYKCDFGNVYKYNCHTNDCSCLKIDTVDVETCLNRLSEGYGTPVGIRYFDCKTVFDPNALISILIIPIWAGLIVGCCCVCCLWFICVMIVILCILRRK